MVTKKKGRGGGRSGGRGGKSRGGGQLQQQGHGGHKVHQNQFLQQQRRLQVQRNEQCRLFHLQQHLVLHCFNYLDQQGREAAFGTMGWSMENHNRRKEELIRQQRMMQNVKERSEWKNGIFKKVLDAERKKTWNEEHKQEEALSQLCDNVERSVSVSNENVASLDEEKRQVQQQEDAPVARDEEPSFRNVLPALFARVDADTLLARLNTRRLYKRLNYYKREDKRKLADHLAKYSNNGTDEENIRDIFEGDLKNAETANRIYPKDITISEMAEKEWEDLMDQARMRNQGIKLPYDPFPTEYELLLFSPTKRAVAAMASYPRSGNSLMRTMYEHTSLRVTGSDMQGGLAKHDLVGEMSVGCDKVQFVKTHFPERRGTPPFQCSRAVLLVRNPFDAIESFFNLMMTGTHTQNISQDIRERTVKHFEEFALKEIRVWTNFHKYWLQQEIPILLVRYEDLVREPAPVMSRVVQFVLEIKDMGSFFGERVHRCIKEQQEIERLGSYKPRSGGIGKALAKYSPELIERMKAEGFEEILKAMYYGDLLNKPVEEWSRMPFLPDHAVEYEATQNLIVVNQGNLARTSHEDTNWERVKRELGLVGDRCNCANCKARRGGMNDNDAGKKDSDNEAGKKVNNEGKNDVEAAKNETSVPMPDWFSSM